MRQAHTWSVVPYLAESEPGGSTEFISRFKSGKHAMILELVFSACVCSCPREGGGYCRAGGWASLSLRAKWGASLEWRRMILLPRANSVVSLTGKTIPPRRWAQFLLWDSTEDAPSPQAECRMRARALPLSWKLKIWEKPVLYLWGLICSFLSSFPHLLACDTGTRFNGTLFRTYQG